MNQSGNPPFSFRDLAHAAVLLILVPIVFYGGYQLVSHSTETTPEPITLGTQAAESVKLATASWMNAPQPPPGTAWIEEVDRLRSKLSSISMIDSSTREQKNRLDDQLSLFREHCETFANDVHDRVNHETHLGRTLLRFANEIDRLQSRSPHTTLPHNWQTEFEAVEAQRLAQQALSMNDAFDQLAAPVRRAHATQLASVKRQNRELADELQRTLDSIEKVERTTREQVAKRRRLEAFAKDKDEIERLLKPFVTPGYLQLGEHWNDWQRKAEKQPLSYRDLERVGALSDDIEGIRLLAYIGGTPSGLHPKSARPLGSFPKWYENTLSIPTNLEAIKRAQQLIKLHSVYLIEAGRLQP